MEVRAPEGRAQAAGTRLMPGEPGRRLMIDRLLALLAEQGEISEETRQTLSRDALLSSADRHPLVMIAERKLKGLNPPHAMLDVDWLCQWLAGQIGWRHVRIDPLKVDFSRIGEEQGLCQSLSHPAAGGHAGFGDDRHGRALSDG